MSTKDKSALGFIDDFKKLLEENDTQQRRVNALRGEEQELTASIERLKKELDSLTITLRVKEEECLNRIRLAQENSDRVFRQESARHDRVNADLEAREAKVAALEPKLRQLQTELDQKHIELLAFGNKLKHLEIETREAQDEATRIQQENILNSAKIATERASLVKEQASLEAGKCDLNEHLHIYKTGCCELQAKSAQIKCEREELENDKRQLKREQEKVSELYSDIAKQKKEIETQNALLDEKRKNNNDKERSINAMKIELDFKIAQLERGKGKA